MVSYFQPVIVNIRCNVCLLAFKEIYKRLLQCRISVYICICSINIFIMAEELKKSFCSWGVTFPWVGSHLYKRKVAHMGHFSMGVTFLSDTSCRHLLKWQASRPPHTVGAVCGSLYSMAEVWNSLPPDIKNINEYNTFKLNQKRWLQDTNGQSQSLLCMNIVVKQS